MTYTVTVFKNIKETEAPFYRDVKVLLDRVKNGESRNLVKKIREEKDKFERNELKKLLPAICFSGKFNKRNDSSLVEHSGLVCLDFDGYAKKKDLLYDKDKLSKDKFALSVFISPSGNGLKVLVKIPPESNNHVSYFNAIGKHFNSPHFDSVVKNVSRVCYESFDPLIYVNYDSELWTVLDEPEYVEVVKNVDAPTIPITDENKIVEILVKWWTKKYPMVDGQRNHNVFVLAMAFNDYGIAKSLAGYVLNQYSDTDFPIGEISRTIDSAYINTGNFGTKYYEDTEKISEIKSQLNNGVSKNDIRYQLNGSDIDSEIIELVLNRIENSDSLDVFWTKNDKGLVKIIHHKFKTFLEDSGFYKFCPEGGKNYVFVKVTNNLIDHTSEKEIKDFILNYLESMDDMSIYNYFADQTRFFKEDFLTLLSTIDIYFIEDTKDASYLYYINCAVKITENNVEPIDYLDLGGYVWKDHVIDRIFDICDDNSCDYKQFIRRICANDDARVKTMESTIGFMMHGYKNLSYCPAIILNDEVISDNPEGGTGKGLFMSAIGKMKKLVVIDGKAFAFEKSFPYQLVSADTQALCFDDVKKHFDFERLFSVVTEGLTLEKKNKDAIKIPFSRSPKIAITTNYAIKGSGNSFARRKWEIELHQHYSKDYTPLDEFGKHFFADWDEFEWCQFDNYMVSCLQLYLREGLVKSSFVNLNIRNLSAETSPDFIEWCGLVNGAEVNQELIIGRKIRLQDAYNEFISEYPDYAPKSRYSVSRMKFGKWVHSYGLFKTGIPPQVGRDMHGKWMRIVMSLDDFPNSEEMFANVQGYD